MTPKAADQKNPNPRRTTLTTPGWRSCRSCRSSWAEGLLKRVSDEQMQRQGNKLTLVNVGQNTTLCNGDVTKQLVQLLVVPDGELKMPGDDTGLLVVTGGVAGQLENFGSEVLEDSGQVDRGTGTDTLSVVALAEQTMDTTDRERKTGLRGPTMRKSAKNAPGPKDVDVHRARREDHQLGKDSRLRVLGTAGLAAGLAASSHFVGLKLG
jgi:hypothetical protein